MTPNIGLLIYIPNTKCIAEKNSTNQAIAIPVQTQCFFVLGNQGYAINQRSNAFGATTKNFNQSGQSAYLIMLQSASRIWWS